MSDTNPLFIGQLKPTLNQIPDQKAYLDCSLENTTIVEEECGGYSEVKIKPQSYQIGLPTPSSLSGLNED